MDVVTQSLLREFAQSQKIESRPEFEQFEAFVNYIVVSDIYPEEFDFSVVSTGEGEFGIDGIAIIVNDAIVDDEEQLDDCRNTNCTCRTGLCAMIALVGRRRRY